MLSPRLETERLILRRWKKDDIDDLYKMISDKRLFTYLKKPNITKEEEEKKLDSWLRNVNESLEERWAITLKTTGAIIGQISVESVNAKNNYCTIGFMLQYAYWGHSYASEALSKVTDYLLNKGYYLVEGCCNELNIASSKTMLKAGFTKDGYIKERRLNKDGTYTGLEYYSKKLSKTN